MHGRGRRAHLDEEHQRERHEHVDDRDRERDVWRALGERRRKDRVAVVQHCAPISIRRRARALPRSFLQPVDTRPRM